MWWCGGRYLSLVMLDAHSLICSLPFQDPYIIASNIKKMQRNFLWFGNGDFKRDYSISWEVVYRPKEVGGLGMGELSLGNYVHLRMWLRWFPQELWYLASCYLRAFIVYNLMDWMLTFLLDGYIDVLSKLLHKYFFYNFAWHTRDYAVDKFF